MNRTVKVLSIDDDHLVQKIIGKTLENGYDTLFASSGNEGIELAKESLPDVIILDVEMPGMNGYEVCDQLKHDAETQDIPIIFLSSLENLRARMLGYEVGAEDFLVKPFVAEDLIAKINVLANIREERREILKQAEEARRTAYNALTSSAELGLVILFAEHSFTATSHESLSKRFFKVTNSLGLSCSLLVQTSQGSAFFSSKGTVSPLESELMARLKNSGRIHDFGSRTQINYPHISVLIKNMPLDNAERYGRIKDLLPAMLGPADAKISVINEEERKVQRYQELLKSFEVVQSTFEELNTLLKNNREQGFNIMRAMLMELNRELPRMGLEDDQENYILGEVDKAIDAAIEVVDDGQAIGKYFSFVMQQLGSLIEEHSTLVERTQQEDKQEEIPEADSEQDNYSSDIELF